MGQKMIDLGSYSGLRVPRLTEFSAEIVRKFHEHLEKDDPAAWRRCYPRIYREPSHCGSYYSPKTWAYDLRGIALKFEAGMIGQSEQYEFMVGSHSVRYGVPLFWIGKDMAVAIRETRTPFEIDWYDMAMPFDSMTFMLPKGCLTHRTDGDVVHIGYARFRENEITESRLVLGERYGSLNGSMTFLLKTVGGSMLHWNMPLDAYGSKLKLPDLDQVFHEHLGDGHVHHSFFNIENEMTDDDNEVLLKAIHYCFGAILLMMHRPDLVTRGSLEKKVMKKGELPREFWSPNILGENYRIRRETIPGGGTHASPRGHWVRNYYREQRFSPQLMHNKTLFVDPLWRGGGNEEPS